LVVVGAGGQAALTALRTRAAVVSGCDDSVRALAPGTRVRLNGCAVDMFHVGFLVDADGTRSHRIVPVRPGWGSANAPGRVALALPSASATDPTALQSTARADSRSSKLADLDETTGVVWGQLNALPRALAEVPGFQHGLAADAMVVEAQPLSLVSRSAALVITGLLTLALGVFLFICRRRADRSGAEESVDGPPSVRWGLVAVGVLIGLTALWRGLNWYFDPMRAAAPAIVTPVAIPDATARASTPSTATLTDPPTREEIALLASSDPANRLLGADALLGRAVTADVMTVAEHALRNDPSPALEARLVCLKSRDQGPGSLDFLLSRFPRDRRALDWNLKPEVMCVLDALVARADEAPERVRDALMPAVYATNAATREKALRAFRLMNLPDIPAMLIAEANLSGGFQREAVSAALALGAIRHNPALVEGALRDTYTRPIVSHALLTDPHPNAARVVARAAAERAGDPELDHLAREREKHTHDVSAAMVEIVGDASEPEWKRVAATQHLRSLGEVGAIYELTALAPTLDPGDLKTTVDSTVRVLRERQAAGLRPQMRTLPQ
jgi:hypothetical protein